MSLLKRPIAWVIGAAITMFAVLWLLGALTSGQRAKTEARLGRNTTEAAIASGGDAVGTIGAQGAAEDAVDTITRENNRAIHDADGASTPIAAPARDAGLRSLCRRAAYRERPECLQHAPAR